MVITARSAYNPYLGKEKVGKCLVCKDFVYNYRYGRFSVRIVYRNGGAIGYCHQACYEKWNPKIGWCIFCGKWIRQKGNYMWTNRDICCANCFREVEEENRLNTLQIIKTAIKVVFTNSIPLGREIYICYSIAKFTYNKQNTIYNAIQDKSGLKQEAYNVMGNRAKVGLTNLQIDIIWDKINENIPDDLKDKAKNILTETMESISEKEISIVENALRYFWTDKGYG